MQMNVGMTPSRRILMLASSPRRTPASRVHHGSAGPAPLPAAATLGRRRLRRRGLHSAEGDQRRQRLRLLGVGHEPGQFTKTTEIVERYLVVCAEELAPVVGALVGAVEEPLAVLGGGVHITRRRVQSGVGSSRPAAVIRHGRA